MNKINIKEGFKRIFLSISIVIFLLGLTISYFDTQNNVNNNDYVKLIKIRFDKKICSFSDFLKKEYSSDNFSYDFNKDEIFVYDSVYNQLAEFKEVSKGDGYYNKQTKKEIKFISRPNYYLLFIKDILKNSISYISLSIAILNYLFFIFLCWVFSGFKSDTEK